MTALLLVEARRYLARRLTRVLIGVALAACAVTGVVVFAQHEDTPPPSPAEVGAAREAEVERCIARSAPIRPGPSAAVPDEPPAPLVQFCRQNPAGFDPDRRLHLTTLWQEDGGDAVLLVTFIFLCIGALVGAASMVGAEWKSGTFTTLLTWEPRRVRVAMAKLLVAGLLAMAVAVALQLVLTAALVPTVILRGTTEGADAEWFRGALSGLLRGATLTGISAVAGASIAMIGRSTSAALGAAFVYLAIGEAVVRGWKPKLARWLVGENSAIFLTGRRLENVPFDRPFALAALTLAAFAVALVAAATVTFRARDVAA